MSSFRKRNIQKPIPGTRTSPQTGQVITSSGNPSMDAILGGGLPIGSICLIEEDKYVTHSKVLVKYFLAEGLLSQQTVFLGTLDDDPVELLRKLPKPLDEEELNKEAPAVMTKREEANCADGAGDSISNSRNGLRIAWRYNDLPIVNSEQSNAKIGHNFNLLEQMDPSLLDWGEITYWNGRRKRSPAENWEEEPQTQDGEGAVEDGAINEMICDALATPNTINKGVEEAMESADQISDEQMTPTVLTSNHKAEDNTFTTPPATIVAECKKESKQIFHNPEYLSLLDEITDVLRCEKFSNASASVNNYQKGLCRVCITSLASPLWYDEHFSQDILKFLTVLRGAVGSTSAVCFITLPMHLVAKCDASLVHKIRNLVDFAIELESFAGSARETNPAFRDYSGLFHLHKISAINTLNAFKPETSDLAFKLRRKKFVIEKLHLPPELQELHNEDNESDIASTTISCASNSKTASMDF